MTSLLLRCGRLSKEHEDDGRKNKRISNSKLGIFEQDGDFRELKSTRDSIDALHC